MTKSKPNIHILELYNRYYMYDAGTNAIFSITKEMCRFLMAILNSNGEIEVGDELKEFTLKLGDLTDDEREIILKGCLINYNRQ